MGGGRGVGLGGGVMNMWASMQADIVGGERRDAGKGAEERYCIWGEKIEVLGMLTSEVETAKTVPRQV